LAHRRLGRLLADDDTAELTIESADRESCGPAGVPLDDDRFLPTLPAVWLSQIASPMPRGRTVGPPMSAEFSSSAPQSRRGSFAAGSFGGARGA
jgi:hypothetical protein